MKIIISPSGNLYGSENVLFDYLKNSRLYFDEIYVPEGSMFQNKLNVNGFNTRGFKNPLKLYCIIFFKVFHKPGTVVYCNEGGHSRYMILLSKLLPWVLFSIHIRMIEDTNPMRFSGASGNQIKILSISQSVSKRLSFSNITLYDGYLFEMCFPIKQIPKNNIIIGIIGRVTESKGIFLLAKLLENLKFENVKFYLYGGIDPNIKHTTYFQNLIIDHRVAFKGVINDKIEMYANVDLVLHLNAEEALGRVFFESLDYGKPFIGLSYEGIREISEVIDYPYVYMKTEIDCLINEVLAGDFRFDLNKISESRQKAIRIFNISEYSHTLDKILN